jgi:hypothetical protein
MKLAAITLLTAALTGCDQREGSVIVDVGQVPLAAAYRVDLYAEDGGLDLVEGKFIVQGNQVNFDGVDAGRWSVLVQAQNGDQTTIAHSIGKVVVKANETTEFMAGNYKPGMPDSPTPESDTVLESFGPDGSALLTALYGPGLDSLPAAEVTLRASNGMASTEPLPARSASLNRTVGVAPGGCATALLIEQQEAAKEAGVLQQETTPTETRPNWGQLAPGQSGSFYVATTFREVECVRLLNDSQTEHCVIFAELVDGDPVLDDARALEVANAFDRDNPFMEGDTGIYDTTRARYGSEWNVNPVGGRDQDQRVILVFLSSQSIGGAGYYGFFNPNDERSQAESPISNVGEILFINADRTKDDLYDGLSTVSHEFTHLIMWNQKFGRDGTFPEGATLENATIDEGLAVLNEDLSGFSFEGEQGGNSFLLGAVQELLTTGLNRPFFQFKGAQSDYGAGYLLMRYLHDQFGAEKLKEITTSPAAGRENIGSILQQPFPSVFGNFAQAVALNGQPGVAPELSYDELDLNSTYIDRDGELYVLEGLQQIGALTFPGNYESQVTLQPWGTVFYRAGGGDGSSLSWTAIGVDSLLTRITSLSGPTPTEPEATRDQPPTP